MGKPEAAVEEPIVARVVHRSVLVEKTPGRPVIKLMLNLAPQGRDFVAGADVAFLAPGSEAPSGLRRYSIDSIGQVPFEESIDITLYVRDHGTVPDRSTLSFLAELRQGDSVPLYGPFAYPFYPPMGSRSNMILIGAGCGVVPFRHLAHKIQARRLDWMGKVLMLEGDETGLEHLYLNEPGVDQDQYFDGVTQRAFDALKTRYSATAFDRTAGVQANVDALWRLMGQGRVYVYLAGYRAIADAMDRTMSDYLRLSGRWQEAKDALIRDGHWLEILYD